MIASLLLLATAQTAPISSSFTVDGVSYCASMNSIGDGGLLWIKPGDRSSSLDFVEIIDDPSFEPRRMCSYSMKGNSGVRIVLAEYYRSSWTYARMFLVSSKGSTEVLDFSHRNPESLKLISDRAGNLTEVRFRDRWIGAALRPAKYRRDPAPGKRWERETRFHTQTNVPWKAHHSQWHAVTAP